MTCRLNRCRADPAMSVFVVHVPPDWIREYHWLFRFANVAKISSHSARTATRMSTKGPSAAEIDSPHSLKHIL